MIRNFSLEHRSFEGSYLAYIIFHQLVAAVPSSEISRSMDKAIGKVFLLSFPAKVQRIHASKFPISARVGGGIFWGGRFPVNEFANHS